MTLSNDMLCLDRFTMALFRSYSNSININLIPNVSDRLFEVLIYKDTIVWTVFWISLRVVGFNTREPARL